MVSNEESSPSCRRKEEIFIELDAQKKSSRPFILKQYVVKVLLLEKEIELSIKSPCLWKRQMRKTAKEEEEAPQQGPNQHLGEDLEKRSPLRSATRCWATTLAKGALGCSSLWLLPLRPLRRPDRGCRGSGGIRQSGSHHTRRSEPHRNPFWRLDGVGKLVAPREMGVGGSRIHGRWWERLEE